jgi:guanylate cyclase
MAIEQQAGSATRGRSFLRIVSIADEPSDDDDLLLRKRVGVAAGYATIVAPLSLPLQAQGTLLALALVLGVGLSVFSAVNLVILAFTRAFERYVRLLVGAGVVFVPLATIVGGGITRSGGIAWAFLVPAYAIMALGPREGRRWFLGFLVMVAIMAGTDPIVVANVPAPPYLVQLYAQAIGATAPLTIVFLLLVYTDVRRRQAEARADELLTNAIPRDIALRLKRGEARIAERYAAATVLFADIAGFTPWAQRTDPGRVVELLDDLFTRFDELTARHGLEKIKTIGDAYMAVAGAPVPRLDHAPATVAFARALLLATAAWRAENDVSLEVRVGAASGPIVAGVIGTQRILFDLWGDTVNLAERMESSGIPGRIQIAASTYELAHADGLFERRVVEVKGLGPVEAYLAKDR